MMQTSSIRNTALALAVAGAVAPSFITSDAHAQAWVGPEDAVNFSLAYSYLSAGDHILDKEYPLLWNGETTEILADTSKTNAHIFVLQADVTLLERLAVKANAAMVMPKFTQLTAVGAESAADDGSYHAVIQDVGLEARYMLLEGAGFALTPFLGGSIPTHNYIVLGHAAAGRGLAQLNTGINAGFRFEQLGLPSLFMHGRYQFSLVARACKVGADGAVDSSVPCDEQFSNINLNRSAVNWMLGYFLMPELMVGFHGEHQFSHGGIDWGRDLFLANPGPTPELLAQHDQITSESFFRMGGSVSVFLLDKINLQAAYTRYVTGANTHDGHTFLFSVGYDVAL